MILNVYTFGYRDDTKCFGDVIECFINGDMTDDEMNNSINGDMFDGDEQFINEVMKQT